MPQFTSLFNFTSKQWGSLLLLLMLLSMGISYVTTYYTMHSKAQELGRFNLKRLEVLLAESNSINQFAVTLKEGDCDKIREYMKFRPYYRGVILFNEKAMHCSSSVGEIDLPLNSLLPEDKLVNAAQYILSKTPGRPDVPAIIVISKNVETHSGSIVVIEGEYFVDAFMQPEAFPRLVSNVVLG